jgi:hypothetical protein
LRSSEFLYGGLDITRQSANRDSSARKSAEFPKVRIRPTQGEANDFKRLVIYAVSTLILVLAIGIFCTAVVQDGFAAVNTTGIVFLIGVIAGVLLMFRMGRKIGVNDQSIIRAEKQLLESRDVKKFMEIDFGSLTKTGIASLAFSFVAMMVVFTIATQWLNNRWLQGPSFAVAGLLGGLVFLLCLKIFRPLEIQLFKKEHVQQVRWLDRNEAGIFLVRVLLFSWGFCILSALLNSVPLAAICTLLCLAFLLRQQRIRRVFGSSKGSRSV